MSKIYKNIDRNKAFGFTDNQIPHVKFELPDGWKLSYQYEPEISHGDIIEHTDGTKKMFNEGDQDGSLFYLKYKDDKTGIDWFLDLEWTPIYDKYDYTNDGDYSVAITKDDPNLERSRSLPWIKVIDKSKHFLVALMQELVELITNNDLEGLKEFRAKYHTPFSHIDEEEFWQNPAAYWKKPKTLEQLIKRVKSQIDPETLCHKYKDEIFGYESAYMIKEYMKSVREFYLQGIKEKDVELGDKIENVLNKVEFYLKSLEKQEGFCEQNELSKEQYEFVAKRFGELYENLTIRLKEEYDG
jgi:hypothetical protein